MLVFRRLVSLGEMVKARGIATGPHGGRYYVGSERRDPKTGRTTRQYVGQETGTSSRWSEHVRDETGRDRRLPPEGHVLVRHYRGQEVRVTESAGTFTVHVDGREAGTGRSLTGALSHALGRAVSGYSFMRLGGAWEAPAGRDWAKTAAAAHALHEKIAARLPDAKVVVEHRRGAGVRAHVAHPNGERYVTDMDEDGRVEGTWRLVGEHGRKWERIEGKIGAKPAEVAPPPVVAPAPAPEPATAPETKAPRQRGGDYTDVGEKIGGARKDLAALREKYDTGTDDAVTLDDLGAIEEDPAFARSLVTRERHFGTRTEQAESFKAQGMSAGAGYLTHRLLSAIDAKPADSPTARRQFVEASDRVQSAIRSWRTREDVLAGMRQIQDEMRGHLYTADEQAERDRMDEAEAPLLAKREAAWRDLALRRAVGGKDAGIEKAEAAFKAADDAAGKARSDHYPRRSELRLAAVARAEADPDSMARVLRSLGDEFAGYVGGYLEGETPKGRDYASHRESHKAAQRKAYDLDKADDWSWGAPRDRPATIEGERKQVRKFTREPDFEAKRVGGATKPYASQTLLDDFGFRGAEYGNWVDSADAREHTQRAGEALADMAEVLGLDPKHVSFNGRLGIAFGARGHGHANAHYEPSRKVINLTRTRGGGTLAHEWAHALDNVVAMVSTNGLSHHTSHVTESGWQAPGVLPERVATAFRRVGEAIYRGDFRPTETITIKAADLKHGAAGYWPDGEALLRKHGGDAQKAAQEFADSKPFGVSTAYAPWFVKKTGQDVTIRQAITTKRSRKREGTLATAGEAAIGRGPGGRTTEYAATANEMGTYWRRPAEMFARAFETFMHDELAAKGRASPYLVSGVSEASLALHEAHGILEEIGGHTSIWPRGGERARINDAMRELVAALRETGTMKKALVLLRGRRLWLGGPA